MHKKTLLSMLAVLVAIVILVGAGTLPGVLAAGNQQTTETPSTEVEPVRTISVNGTGKVSLDPDIATIYIGVHTENTDAQEAVASNNSQAEDVASALRGFGIAERDIKTTNFSIYPRQDYDNEGKITGITYIVDNTVQVTVRELDQLGELLDGVVQAGANSINGIEFSVADPEAAYDAALQAAVENARSRAETLAAAAGVELGEVQSISSYIGGGPVPVYRDFGGAAVEAAAMSVPVSPGQTEIQVEVSIVYAIQ